MSRVLLCVVLSTFLFAGGANALSQACLNHTQSAAMAGCYPHLTSFGSTSLCNASASTCRMIFDNILGNCAPTELIYKEVQEGLDTICNAPPGCFNATRDLQGDFMCDNARSNFSAASPFYVCNGTCRNLLDNVVAECGTVANGSCANATQNLYSAGLCYPSLSSFGDPNLCNTSSPTACRMKIDDILTYCNSSEFLYIDVTTNLNLLCNTLPGCFNATRDIRGDPSCDMARSNLTAANPNFVCNGSCRALLDGVATGCGDNATGAGVQAGLNAVCPSPNSTVVMMSNSTSFMASSSSFMASSSSFIDSSATSILMVPSITTAVVDMTSSASPTPTVDPCQNAVEAFHNSTDCTSVFNSTDITNLCRGPCRVLINGIASNCGSDGFITAADISEHCGGGAGALRMGMLAILMMVLTAVLTA